MNVKKDRRSPFDSKDNIKHYDYYSDQKFGTGIIAIIIILFIYQNFTTLISLTLDSKKKDSVIHPRYSRIHNCEYYRIIGWHKNCIITNSLYNGTYKCIYKHINRTIFDGTLLYMSLIVVEVKYGEIDTHDSSYHGYFIINSSSYTYTLQTDLSIYGHIISYREMVFEGTYLFPVKNNFFLQRNKSINMIFYSRSIINGNVNVIFYNSKNILPPCSQILQYFVTHTYYHKRTW